MYLIKNNYFYIMYDIFLFIYYLFNGNSIFVKKGSIVV